MLRSEGQKNNECIVGKRRSSFRNAVTVESEPKSTALTPYRLPVFSLVGVRNWSEKEQEEGNVAHSDTRLPIEDFVKSAVVSQDNRFVAFLSDDGKVTCHCASFEHSDCGRTTTGNTTVVTGAACETHTGKSLGRKHPRSGVLHPLRAWRPSFPSNAEQKLSDTMPSADPHPGNHESTWSKKDERDGRSFSRVYEGCRSAAESVHYDSLCEDASHVFWTQIPLWHLTQDSEQRDCTADINSIPCLVGHMCIFWKDIVTAGLESLLHVHHSGSNCGIQKCRLATIHDIFR